MPLSCLRLVVVLSQLEAFLEQRLSEQSAADVAQNTQFVKSAQVLQVQSADNTQAYLVRRTVLARPCVPLARASR